MAKHLIKGYITSTQYSLHSKPTIDFATYKPRAEYSPNTVIVAEHEFEVDVPDDFDPRPSMVDSLKEQKRLARAEFAKKVTEIDQRIQSLLAIEHVVAA